LARNSISRSRRATFGTSKYLGSGHARTEVPDSFGAALPIFLSFSITSPPAKAISYTAPSRFTRTSRRFDKALVTDTPTPCSPPEKA
jgi:hypothetical protein